MPRTHLAVAAADLIRRSVQEGRWQRLLPGEYELSRDLQVGRHTVRAALAILAQQGLVQIKKGHRTKITGRRPRRKASGARVIRLISPHSTWEYTPFMYVWSQEVRRMLSQRGIVFHTDQHLKCYSARPELFLKNLVAEAKCGLWVLHVSTARMQHWFSQQQIPTLLAGTPHPEIRLPFVDVHNGAAARHATGLFLSGGHRRLLYLYPDHHFAGDLEALKAARETIESSKEGGEATLSTIEYSEEPGSLDRKLAAAFKSSAPPTAIISGNSVVLCGVYSTLGQLGLRVPQDVSVVSLQSNAFLRHITPSFAHYHMDPKQYARKLVQLASKLLSGESLPQPDHWLIPKYEPGATAAPVRKTERSKPRLSSGELTRS